MSQAQTLTRNQKRTLRTLFFLGVAGISSAQAAGPKEFFLNSAGFELLGNANRISIAPGFNYGVFSWMQVGGSIGYQSIAFGTGSVNTTTFQIGPTFNLDPVYASSNFLFVGYSIRKGSGVALSPEEDPAGSGFALFFGRRIPISSQFSYRPSVGIQMTGKTSFVLNAFAASFFF